MYSPPINSPYRANEEEIDIFLKELNQTAVEQDFKIVITGDLNLETVDWESMSSEDTYEERVVHHLDEMNLQQTLTYGDKPPLDVLLTQSPERIESTQIDSQLEAGYTINGKRCSDHHPFQVNMSTDISTKPPPPKVQHAYHKTDWQKMNAYIGEHPFSPFCYSNIDELVTQWYNWLQAIIDTHIPRVTKHRAQLPPWVSPPTSHQIKMLNTMKRKYERKPHLTQLLKIKRKEKDTRDQMLSDQTAYEEKLFKGKRMSDMQKYLKSLHKTKQFPDEMYYATTADGQPQKKLAKTDKEKCNLFNDFFSDVFIDKGQIQQEQTFPKSKLNYFTISEREIEETLRGLQINKACGPDDIGNIILKNTPALAKSLRLIFQTSLNKGKFPTSWKICEITPIYKENDRADISQYRPISLLKNVSKVFEKILFTNIYPLVERQLSDDQYGFRQARSVVLQLLIYLDEIFNRLDNKEHNEIHALYIDFRKAFDKVTHQKLISKLNEMGIGGKLLKLLASYLTDRQQRVKIRDHKSEPSKVTSGVPQGSILGPLMFIVYINTLPNCVKGTNAYGYADDFKVVTSNIQEANQALKHIQQWSNENDMVLNLDKSKILSIKGETVEPNQELEVVKTQKDLGVIMSSNLSWAGNCRKRVSMAWRSFYYVKRNISPIANVTTKLNGYVGYVVPVLTYASEVWFPSKLESKALEKVQKTATKWIGSSKDDYKTRLARLEILPISMYMELHDLLLLLSIMKGNYNIRRSKIPNIKLTETRQNNEFEIPKHRLRKCDENFWTRATRLYNIVRKTTDKPLSKKLLTQLYTSFFHRRYNELDSCSWRILCNCGNCNPLKKLVLDD